MRRRGSAVRCAGVAATGGIYCRKKQVAASGHATAGATDGTGRAIARYGPAFAGSARIAREEIERALGVLASREGRLRVYERIAARAGIALDPASCWLLFRIDEHAPVALEGLGDRLHIPLAGLRPALAQLTQAGFIAGDSTLALTDAGRPARDRLISARQEGLTALLVGWAPEQQRDLADLLGRLATSLLTDTSDKMPATAPASQS